jgi:hypothetical protein
MNCTGNKGMVYVICVKKSNQYEFVQRINLVLLKNNDCTNAQCSIQKEKKSIMFINSRKNLMLYFKLKPHPASAAWEDGLG